MFKSWNRKPKPVLIMGSGRSGTSLLAGSIVHNYDYTGEKPLHRDDESNPTGFFEDYWINYLNDRILEESGVILPGKVDKTHPEAYGGWVSLYSESKSENLKADLRIIRKINELTSYKNYCFKDPRFSYTFPLWEGVINRKDLMLLIVFRSPGKTVRSMLKEPTSKAIRLNKKNALEIWFSMYNNILSNMNSNMIFVHYDQILNGDVHKIEKKLNISFDKSFVNLNLNRSEDDEVPTRYSQLYSQLVKLSRVT